MQSWPPPLSQALPPLLQWAPLLVFCLVPPLTEDDNHLRGRNLLHCRTLAAIAQPCLVVGLGFKYRLVGSCDHRLPAWAKRPGGGKKCLWWETPRDYRTLNAVGDLWRHSDPESLQNQDYLELLAQPLAHDCVPTVFEVLQAWWLHNFSATDGNAQSLSP